MVESKTGLVQKICIEVANANGTPPLKFNCIIHQQVLCSKVLKFEDIMNVVVSTVNFIRRHGLNHRQFQTFLSEIDSDVAEREKEYFNCLKRKMYKGNGTLKEEFANRFKDFHNHKQEIQMFRNPFSVSPVDIPGIYQMQIIDLQANDALKTTFQNNSLLEFYSSLPEEYSDLKKFAVGMFSVFGSTYICEQTF
ncbi:general transcription factor II-I repeat domain-containing protein 2-like [Palaemon carinicauda]|uniref:general transcription factor II-I repeat domain-containing protein 2-like n=1 Tax=Palaemon carinicauda TaxID=392227 RepID=UPI0035B69093